MYFRKYWWIGFCLLLGCDKTAEIAKTNTPAKEGFVILEETYGDPFQYNMPRFQFVWRGPGEEGRSIWSCKIDGTDVRRAWAWDRMRPEGIWDI